MDDIFELLSKQNVYVQGVRLTTDNVEPIYGMVTRMMIKHRTQLLSTTKGDLGPRLANLKSKFAKLKCFFHLLMTLFL